MFLAITIAIEKRVEFADDKHDSCFFSTVMIEQTFRASLSKLPQSLQHGTSHTEGCSPFDNQWSETDVKKCYAKSRRR